MAKNNSRPLVFATVNAGTNNFTNITVKSVLNFHPNAKVFVFDVVPDRKFTPIDEDVMRNVEVVKGISTDDIVPPVIDLPKSSLPREQLVDFVLKIGRNPVEVSLNGDLQHTINIQNIIDTIGQNFILIDSDAPLIRPVDFAEDCRYATIADTKRENYSLNGIDATLLSRIVLRFAPFIQLFNVDLIRKFNLFYYNEELLKDNLDVAFRFPLKPDTLIFPTGSLFLRRFEEELVNYGKIRSGDYVEHFVAWTWRKDVKSKNAFYLKYQHLFSNQIPLEKI